ncbi:MAG: hypothetical protein K2W82_16840 [Candidatus Obscuribacterales bacterium]|nr:hypothetical protein [Candidatus Obscuribacterales bacterium]
MIKETIKQTYFRVKKGVKEEQGEETKTSVGEALMLIWSDYYSPEGPSTGRCQQITPTMVEIFAEGIGFDTITVFEGEESEMRLLVLACQAAEEALLRMEADPELPNSYPATCALMAAFEVQDDQQRELLKEANADGKVLMAALYIRLSGLTITEAAKHVIAAMQKCVHYDSICHYAELGYRHGVSFERMLEIGQQIGVMTLFDYDRLAAEMSVPFDSLLAAGKVAHEHQLPMSHDDMEGLIKLAQESKRPLIDVIEEIAVGE